MLSMLAMFKSLWFFNLSNTVIISRVKQGTHLRPDTSSLEVADYVVKCIKTCWDEDPENRPDFRFVRVKLKEMQSGLSVHYSKVFLFFCSFFCFFTLNKSKLNVAQHDIPSFLVKTKRSWLKSYRFYALQDNVCFFCKILGT